MLRFTSKNFIKRHVDLTPDQKKIYEQMKKEAMAILNGKVTTTMTVLTQLMRLHQITCGHFTADDGSVQEVKSNRIKELMNVLSEIDGKAIIWANYQNDIQKIINTIETKKDEDQNLIDSWIRGRLLWTYTTRR